MTNGKKLVENFTVQRKKKKKKKKRLYSVQRFVISFKITEENNKIGKHIIINLIFQRYKIFKTS